MYSGSLRLRLMLAAAIATSLALAIAGMIFYIQFQKHVERLALKDFDAYFDQLVSGIGFDDNGHLIVEDDLADPRFMKQYGGMYWQIDLPDKTSLRSRSLWDGSLDVPTPAKIGEIDVHMLNGPDGTELLASERYVAVEWPDGTPQPVNVTIAIDRRNILNAISGFSGDIIKGFSLLYATLMLSALAQVLLGLSPLRAIRDAVANVRDGTAKRMQGDFPSELFPLVDEINTLLESRDKQLERTRQRSGNLAHGLKTPLTVMDAIASELKPSSLRKSAREIVTTTRSMRSLIERELARARMSANPGRQQVTLRPVVDRIVNALKKTNLGKPKSWAVIIEKDAVIAIDADDLTEVLGNLLDNAQEHAATRIQVSYGNGTLSIEDDGPGVPDEMLPEIFKRGIRLDEKKPGSGLGLAIVQDVADAYGADITASRSSLGGLKVSLTPPRPAD
jgi:signal transduction histidine kinase